MLIATFATVAHFQSRGKVDIRHARQLPVHPRGQHQFVVIRCKPRQKRPFALIGQALPFLRVRQQELRLTADVQQKANHLRRIIRVCRAKQSCASIPANYFSFFTFHAHSSIFS